MNQVTKHCWDCESNLPIERFGKWKYGKDGLRNQCKKCHNRETIEWQRTPEGRIKAIQYKAKYRASTYYRQMLNSLAYKAKAKKWNEARRRRDRNKVLARTTVRNEVIAGRIPSLKKMKCDYCGFQAKEYHHHHGYEKKFWLDVIPLCVKCHKVIHILERLPPGYGI